MSIRVYPHVCGGTETIEKVNKILEGLSPRVWGNPRAGSRGSRPSRSIPTCVGEPRTAALLEMPLRVYPHVCGGTWLPH